MLLITDIHNYAALSVHLACIGWCDVWEFASQWAYAILVCVKHGNM